MQLKPIAERTNLPLIAAFVVWVVAIFVMGFSSTAYFVLTTVAIALFACRLAFNVQVRRQDHP